MDAYQAALETVLHGIAKERQYENYKLEVNPTFTGGANYTSRLYRGLIKAPAHEDLKFFAKVAAVGEKFRGQAPTDLFFTEQFAYRTLANIFDKIQNDNAVPKEHRLKMPALYGYAEVPPQEVVVLEDLGAEGFASHDRRVAFQWPFAYEAVRQLAILHALSIAMRLNYERDFEEINKALKLRKLDTNDTSMSNMVEQMVSRSIQMTREENRERLTKYMKENMPLIMELFYEPHERPVLLHGDFRMSNTMHKVREDGTYEVVLIDYQTLHLGAMAKDLMYFIFTGSDSEFRRRHYDELLEHYYQQVSLALARLNLDPEKTFPKEEFDNEIKKCTVMGIAFAVFSLPVVTVEEQHAPTLEGEEGVEGILGLELSSLCEERMNGVVDDYIRWGIV